MNTPRNTNEVVIESITQAMAAMIVDRRFEDISITELVRRAGVSRNSFYRNFRDKDDVLRRYIEGETEEWIGKSGWVHVVDPEENKLRMEHLLITPMGFTTPQPILLSFVTSVGSQTLTMADDTDRFNS